MKIYIADCVHEINGVIRYGRVNMLVFRRYQIVQKAFDRFVWILNAPFDKNNPNVLLQEWFTGNSLLFVCKLTVDLMLQNAWQPNSYEEIGRNMRFRKFQSFHQCGQFDFTSCPDWCVVRVKIDPAKLNWHIAIAIWVSELHIWSRNM